MACAVTGCLPGAGASWNLTHVLVTCLPTREDRKTCNGPDRVRGLRFLPVPGGVRCRGILWLCPVKGRACSVLGVSSRCFVGRVVFPCALLGLHGCVPVRPGLYGRASGPLPSPDRKARAARRLVAGAGALPRAARRALCGRRCATSCAGVMLRSVSFRYPRGVLRSWSCPYM